MKGFNKLIVIILVISVIVTLGGCTSKDSDSANKDVYNEQPDKSTEDMEDKNTQDNEDKSKAENTEQNIEDIAIALVEDMIKENYQAAYDNYTYDATMKQAMNPEGFKQVMDHITSTTGDFVQIYGTSQSVSQGYDILAVTCEFSKDYMNINVVFDADKKIAGLNISSPEDLSKTSRVTPEEHEVIVGEGEWQLPGTLSLPEGDGPFPAVVLVHGSGPNDRDETIGPNKIFRDIAWALAEKGIATLRYEKRTREYQQKFAEDFMNLTVKEEVIDDALLAVQLLNKDARIDSSKIYVIGHSLGGYLVPRIGTEGQEQGIDIAGFVIMAGPTRPMDELIQTQLNYLFALDGEIDDTEQINLDMVQLAREKINDPNLDPNTNPEELMGINAKYWIDLRGYQPVEMAKELNRPLLILQGKRDYQITYDEDFASWKTGLEGIENVQFEAFDKLNHLFLSGEGAPNPDEYSIKGIIPKEVIESIVTFVTP